MLKASVIVAADTTDSLSLPFGILLEERELVDAWCITLSDARAVHLMTVSRVTPGQEVRVGLLDGPLGVGKVEAVNNGRVTLRCAFESSAPPRPRVDVLLALPRPKVMRRLWDNSQLLVSVRSS